MLFSLSVMSYSLWPYGLQHTRLPCPLLSPRACSNSCSLSPWCYLSISSSAALFYFSEFRHEETEALGRVSSTPGTHRNRVKAGLGVRTHLILVSPTVPWVPGVSFCLLLYGTIKTRTGNHGKHTAVHGFLKSRTGLSDWTTNKLTLALSPCEH